MIPSENSNPEVRHTNQDEHDIQRDILLVASSLRPARRFSGAASLFAATVLLGVFLYVFLVLNFSFWSASLIAIAACIPFAVSSHIADKKLEEKKATARNAFIAKWPQGGARTNDALIVLANLARVGPRHVAPLFESVCASMQVPEDVKQLAKESLEDRTRRGQREKMAREEAARVARKERARSVAENRKSLWHFYAGLQRPAEHDPKAATWIALCHLFAANRINIRHDVVVGGETEFDREPSWIGSKAKALDLVNKARTMLSPDSRGNDLLAEMETRAEVIRRSPVRERYLGGTWDTKFLYPALPVCHIETLAILFLSNDVPFEHFQNFVSQIRGSEWLSASDDF